MNILITGISGNLGQVTARRLLADGHHVVGCVEPGIQLRLDGIPTLAANLEDEDSARGMVTSAIATTGRIDYGILLAGGFASGTIADSNQAAIDKMIALNFRTAVHVARPLHSHMIETGGGRIVLVGAKPGLQTELATGAVGYALSKSLVFRLAEIINSSGKGVDSAVIVPSIIDTPQNRKSMPDADFSKWVPAEGIAGVISWLCSPDSKHLRETVIKIYGDS